MKTLHWGPNLNLTEIMLEMKCLVITGPIKQTTAYKDVYTSLDYLFIFNSL